MSAATIGIIGGYGRVGLETCRYCMQIPDVQLLVGGRNHKRASDVAAELGSGVGAMPVDTSSHASLDSFCSRCDLLVNTAGPAALIGDNVALAALRRGINYIDVSGTEALYSDLTRSLDLIEKKRLTFIIAAGIFPGLSGVFPAAMADSHFDSVELLEICFVSEGDTLSFNAAYDVVSSLQDGYAHGMRHYVNGRLTSDGVAPRTIDLPSPIGAVQAYPSMSQELLLLAQNRKIGTARAYLSILDNAMAAMFRIRAEKLFASEEQRRQSAELLMRATERDLTDRRRCTMYHLRIQGKTNGSPHELVSILEFHDNDATLTGITAACTARLLLENNTAGNGRFFLWEGVAPDMLMSLLEAHGICPRIEASEKERLETGMI